MVLFSIEKSIGNYLLNDAKILSVGLKTSKFSEIAKRIRGPLSSDNEKLVAQFLEVSYLKDLLEMLRVSCKGTAKEDPANRIFGCCEILDIYDARNAIAHPIREFYPSHWYRIAAIASDPGLEEIGIVEPRAELDAAEDGDIREIDSDWWSRGERYLDNNLPEYFDHESTKLIGRTDELKKLSTLLNSQRYPFVAIVAPGGVGKTALVLEALNRFVHDLSVSGKFGCVIYVTLKQEELGLKGIRKLDSPKTIEALKDKVDRAVDEKSLDGDVPVLLCIDNLETLISNDFQAVEDYIETLPESWKIMVTSRLPIDGAKTFPLGGLDQSSSHILIRKYAASVGFTGITKAAVEQIAAGSAANPLALRLNVDKVNLAGEIVASLKETEVDLVGFSFSGLIDALPTIARNILEVLFVEGTSNRGDIISYFVDESDSASEAVTKLLQTSVVRRSLEEEEESIELTDAIRLLLQRAPLELGFRNRVSSRLEAMRKKKSQHSAIQESKNTDIYHQDFLGDWLPDHLSSHLVDVIRFFRENNPRYADYSRIGKQCLVLEGLPSEHKEYSEFWLMLARLRSWQRDEVASKNAFENAIRLEDVDHRRPTARIEYAKYLKKIGVLDESYSTLKDLMGGYFCSEKNDRAITYRIVWGSLFDLVVKLGDADEQSTLLLSLQAASSERSKNFFFVQRSKVEIRTFSAQHRSNPDAVIDGYIAIALGLKEIIGCEKFGKSAYLLSLFFFKEIGFFLRTISVGTRGADKLQKMFSALDELMKKLIHSQHVKFRDRSQLQDNIRELIRFEVNFVNPFDNKAWRSEAGLQVIGNDQIRKLEREGWVICKVNGVGSGQMPGHLFCNDSEKNRYFVGRRNLNGVDLVEWAKVEVSHTVAIRSIENSDRPGSFPSPREICFF